MRVSRRRRQREREPRNREVGVIAFADLLERLVFTPGRNAKIALLRRYFASEPDPDRGIGLAAVTGELAFTAAKPGLIRELAATRTDPELFAWSYDYVGDLAETVALMWPGKPTNAAPPTLAEVVETPGDRAEIRALGHRRRLARCIRAIGAAGLAEAHHRRLAGRRLGAARQGRTCRDDRRARSRRTTWRRCGTASRRPTRRCSPGSKGAARGRTRRTRRCSARRCWRIRWSRRTGFPWMRATTAPSGNGTASACSSSRPPAASGSIRAAATTSPARSPRSSMR